MPGAPPDHQGTSGHQRDDHPRDLGVEIDEVVDEEAQERGPGADRRARPRQRGAGTKDDGEGDQRDDRHRHAPLAGPLREDVLRLAKGDVAGVVAAEGREGAGGRRLDRRRRSARAPPSAGRGRRSGAWRRRCRQARSTRCPSRRRRGCRSSRPPPRRAPRRGAGGRAAVGAHAHGEDGDEDDPEEHAANAAARGDPRLERHEEERDPAGDPAVRGGRRVGGHGDAQGQAQTDVDVRGEVVGVEQRRDVPPEASLDGLVDTEDALGAEQRMRDRREPDEEHAGDEEALEVRAAVTAAGDGERGQEAGQVRRPASTWMRVAPGSSEREIQEGAGNPSGRSERSHTSAA